MSFLNENGQKEDHIKRITGGAGEPWNNGAKNVGGRSALVAVIIGASECRGRNGLINLESKE